MKHSAILVLILVLGTTNSVFTQVLEYGFPLEAPADPRSVAMGESFVSIPSNPAALSFNPAGLAGLQGISVSYAGRNMDWVPDGWSISSLNATVAVPFGVFALQYNSKVLGTDRIFLHFPDSYSAAATYSARDLSIGFALRLPRGPALGISGKYYDYSESISNPAYESMMVTISPVLVFDIGSTYTLPPLHDQKGVEDSVSFAISFQNIGQRWKVPSYSNAIMIPDWFWKSNGLPQFVRVGGSYGMRVRPAEESDFSPFAAVFSGEFRRLLTPHDPFAGSSYWGFGLECTIYEFLSLRGGASFKPFSNFEGEKNRASFRYGAALRLPMQKFGILLPLTVSFDYTVVPLNTVLPVMGIYPPLIEGKAGTPLPAFSLEFQYTGSPW
jgi:hypothetical protein